MGSRLEVTAVVIVREPARLDVRYAGRQWPKRLSWFVVSPR
jgi:hypothetical protein